MASFGSETRSSHPSPAQVEALVSCLENRLDLAKGFGKTRMHKERARKDWFRISLKLNNMPGGAVKTVKRWMKYWSDKKSGVKRKHTTIERSQEDGMDGETPELSEIEERILALMKACANATSAQLLRRPKKEPVEDKAESAENEIDNCFLIEEPLEVDMESTEETNEVTEEYVSTYRSNDRTQTTDSPEPQHRPAVNSTKWSRFKLSPKLNPQPFSLSYIVDKLCTIERQRLELDRRMLDVIERNSERDLMLTEAVKAMGEGLKALAEAIARN